MRNMLSKLEDANAARLRPALAPKGSVRKSSIKATAKAYSSIMAMAISFIAMPVPVRHGARLST